jgi:hypothetical protein
MNARGSTVRANPTEQRTWNDESSGKDPDPFTFFH